MARRSPSHHLTLVQHEPFHVHRWQAKCSCGWATIRFKSRKTALREFKRHSIIRDHLNETRHFKPRPVTPPERSPFGRAVAA